MPKRPSRFSKKWRKYAAARKIQRRYRKHRSNRRLNKVVKRIIHRQAETMHLDHRFAGSQGASYQILPWGVDSDLLKGDISDLLPVNQLDNIHLDTQGGVPAGDATRAGSSIYMKSIRCDLRFTAPQFQPAVTPATTSIGKTGPDTCAKIRLLVIWDSQGEQSLDPASTNTGVLSEIYDSLADCTAAKRHLPTFKGYRSNKRFKVLMTKHLTLDANKAPYTDCNFTLKVNRKIHYIEGTDTALQGIYLFAMSDYPASTTSHTQTGPMVTNFSLRYYYTDL